MMKVRGSKKGKKDKKGKSFIVFALFAFFASSSSTICRTIGESVSKHQSTHARF